MGELNLQSFGKSDFYNKPLWWGNEWAFQVKKSMKSILKEIQSGKFAREWVKEYQAGLPKYNQLLEDGEKHPIEITGQRLRGLMPWIPKKNIKGAQASYS